MAREEYVPSRLSTTAVPPAAVSRVDFPVRMMPMTLSAAYIRPIVAASESLPLADTQSGSLFQDRNGPAVAWYLPSFELAGDLDTTFAFAATRSGVDAQGAPFYHATLTLAIRKVVPDDAVSFKTNNPTVDLREIPLLNAAAVLAVTASDPQSGAPTSTTYLGQIASSAEDSVLTFTGLLGSGVIVAYENLREGGASLNLTASYDVWRQQSTHPAWTAYPFLRSNAVLETDVAGASVAAPAAVSASATSYERRTVDRWHPEPPPPDAYVQGSATFTKAIAVGTKYANVGYATAYTVSDGTIVRVILSPEDLRNFQTVQSEFSEFTALGDVSSRYPSLRALYVGALSRTIVAVPAQYGIMRGSTGTAAVCQALLDSSAGATTDCTFQFSFVLGPVVSPIDLAQLATDVGASAAAHDCTVVLPLRLDPSHAGTLATPFQTSVGYLAGTQPSTFALSVEITDTGATSPAVVNANLFIKQLTAALEPFLMGQLAIKLDDGYPDAIDVPVVLNFGVTSGTDELGFSIDPTSQAVELINGSPLDLALTRYATAGAALTVTPLAQTLLARQSAPLAGVTVAAGQTILVDRTIALESPLTKSATARYLAFQVQDVQAVQYELNVIAAGIDFAARGITSIGVQIALDDLPQITVPSFTLTPLDESGSQQIALPIQYALTVLNATIHFNAVPADAQHGPVAFTLTNDFIDRPTFVLADSSVPVFPPQP